MTWFIGFKRVRGYAPEGLMSIPPNCDPHEELACYLELMCAAGFYFKPLPDQTHAYIMRTPPAVMPGEVAQVWRVRLLQICNEDETQEVPTVAGVAS